LRRRAGSRLVKMVDRSKFLDIRHLKFSVAIVSPEAAKVEQSVAIMWWGVKLSSVGYVSKY